MNIEHFRAGALILGVYAVVTFVLLYVVGRWALRGESHHEKKTALQVVFAWPMVLPLVLLAAPLAGIVFGVDFFYRKIFAWFDGLGERPEPNPSFKDDSPSGVYRTPGERDS